MYMFLHLKSTCENVFKLIFDLTGGHVGLERSTDAMAPDVEMVIMMSSGRYDDNYYDDDDLPWNIYIAGIVVGFFTKIVFTFRKCIFGCITGIRKT